MKGPKVTFLNGLTGRLSRPRSLHWLRPGRALFQKKDQLDTRAQRVDLSRVAGTEEGRDPLGGGGPGNHQRSSGAFDDRSEVADIREVAQVPVERQVIRRQDHDGTTATFGHAACELHDARNKSVDAS